MIQTQALIIGGGATGTALARDLALRGVNCILVEKGDLNAGASGRNHGLLHSGGRYVSNDQQSARECKQEGDIIKRRMPRCVENNGGLFVAVKGDDERFIADFPSYCAQCGVPCEEITPQEALSLEPSLSKNIIAAYRVEDASIDPFKVSLLNMSQAIARGSRLMRRTRVIGFDVHDKKIRRARLKNVDSGEEFYIEAEQVINCAGAWAGQVCRLAGVEVHIIYSKGTLLVTNDRINHRILNRLRPPSNADILVPGGTVSIIGTTSIQVENPDDIRPTVEETDLIVSEGAVMVPLLERSRFVRAYCGVRPLVDQGKPGGSKEGRAVSRGFALLDHEHEDVENFCTITGGKLTTFRLMAERTGDLVCKKMGNSTACLTRTEPLPETEESQWTEPGLSPKKWMRSHVADDIMICECEMVSKTGLDEIITSIKENNEKPSLVDINMRTRLGRGACQGAFCGTRALAYLYEHGEYEQAQGMPDIGRFFQERWRGLRSILWGDQLIQAELTESIHCGLFDEELYSLPNKGAS